MKRFVILAILLGIVQGFVKAQSTGTLERISLTTLSGYYSVKTGEFQAKASYNTQAFFASNGNYYNLLFIAKNENTGLSNVYVNGQPKWFQRFDVRPFLTTEEWNTGIFVIKYLDKDMPGIGYGMETVYARGIRQELCDSIVSVGEDGYVYKIGKKYYYSRYKEVGSVGQPMQIVWPERMIYEENDAGLFSGEDADRLSEGDVYHYCYWDDKSRGYYYYLYRDDYMPYSVLVINGQFVELFDKYSDEDFRLKYSFNGEHWMAVADQYFWIDGQMKSVEGFRITDFFINDKGDYCYKAQKIGSDEKGETIVINGEIIRKDARVGYFNLNDRQRLSFHFFSGGQYFVYEDGQIKNKTEEFMTFFFESDRMEGLNVRIVPDNKHFLEYVVGEEGLWIDGKQVITTEPFQVVYDLKHNCFRWNCIEPNKEGKTELVIYKYYL